MAFGRGIPISTFYHYDRAREDEVGKVVASNTCARLKEMYKGQYYSDVLDPNSVSNLNIFNGILEDKNHEVWVIAGRFGKKQLFQEVLDRTPRMKRWMIAYLKSLDQAIRYNDQLMFCFIVQLQNGRISMGPGQAMEVMMVNSMYRVESGNSGRIPDGPISSLPAGPKPLVIHYQEVSSPTTVGPLRKHEGRDAEALLARLLAVAVEV